MAVSGDVTLGAANVKLHPYLITLVRWCVSCVWSTATVLLHRLLSTPLQPITGPKPTVVRPKPPARAPGTEHLHPEPRVECQVLHQPDHHTMDVIFVHGLYGSLGNTWRQGDWRQKYATAPKIVTLIDHSKQNTCKCHENSFKNENIKCNDSRTKITTNDDIKCVEANMIDLNESDISISNINEKLSKKIIPQENDLITEQFYNNTLMDQNDDRYDTQANFVSDMFRKETNCDKCCEDNKSKSDVEFKCKSDISNHFKCDDNESEYNNDDYKCDEDLMNDSSKRDEENEDFKYKFNEVNEFNECKCDNERKCEVGCGCICNECYSSCWPRDWVREDFPGARIISINYTSDPYLWRPLWIKENKRLNLYQRAEQMIEQLLDMGVGEKPIIWVGHSKGGLFIKQIYCQVIKDCEKSIMWVVHSKGGLFIKQIYCQAYEAYMKTNKEYSTHDETEATNNKRNKTDSTEEINEMTPGSIDTIIKLFSRDQDESKDKSKCLYEIATNDDITRTNNNMNRINDNDRTNENLIDSNDMNKNINRTNNNTDTRSNGRNNLDNKYKINTQNVMNNNSCVMNEIVEYENIFENLSANDNIEYANIKSDKVNIKNDNLNDMKRKYADLENGDGNQDLTSSIEEAACSGRGRVWSSSRGFMFYSVPHRGSPLADIKTPLTARSVDLLEIAKDCPLVLELQARWRRATDAARGAVRVRSAVETSRTLMSVLWLRIVSTHSADAGIGTLSGISVDHREICKPTSRTCQLYTMLTELIHEAISCTCR